MVGETATQTCGEAVIGLLAEYGVSTVFGIPGVHTLELYRGLVGDGAVRHVLARHEQGAGFMADGYGRTLGEPGVCLVISGPGITNVITPVAQAYHDSKPLLVISGAVAGSRHGHGTIHDLPDQQALMEQVTAFSARIDDPAELPEVLARAFASFRSGRPRPVHIAIPVDVLSQPAGDLTPVAPASDSPIPASGELDAAARVLAGARRPLLLLGGGAADAGVAALRLAERIAAPIGLSINAKGAIPASHPLCLGSALTFPPILDMACDADVVVAVGTEFSELDWWAIDGPPKLRGRLIRIDIDHAQLAQPIPAAIGLHGDASWTLEQISDRIAPRTDAEPDRRAVEQGVAEAVAEIAWPASISEYLPVLSAIDAALPSDRIIAADSTQPAYAANHALGVEAARSWMMPVGYGTLGCALPMAIGAKVAAPDRAVCCLVGDGGILFTLQELATARDLGLGLPIVVWNNTGYGEIADAMSEAGIPPIATAASAHDLVAIARGFGCHGEHARDLGQLTGLIADATTRGCPTLIEVRP